MVVVLMVGCPVYALTGITNISVGEQADIAAQLNGEGKFEAALDSINIAIKIDPTNAHAYYNKGIILFNLHRYEESVEAFDLAINIDPNNSDAKHREKAWIRFTADQWYKKGSKLGGLGKFEEAIEAFDKAIEIDPKYEVAWGVKGLCFFELGRYKEAIKAYDQSLKINPENSATKRNREEAIKKLIE